MDGMLWAWLVFATNNDNEQSFIQEMKCHLVSWSLTAYGDAK